MRSPKVIIRPWSLEDIPALVLIANNFNVWKTLRDRFPYPYTETDAIEFINMAKTRQPAHHFCIESDGHVAGSVGIITFKENYRKNVEMGYFLGEAFWGKGIATVAVDLMVKHILANFDTIRIFAVVFADNISSMRVLEKNGFILESIQKNAVIKENRVMDEYIWVRFNPQH